MEVLCNVAAGLILSLGSSTVNEIGLWLGVADELHKLSRTVSTIQAVLLHAEEQSTHNPAVKHWLEMLSEALYDAEDLLDEFSYEDLRQQVVGGSDFSKKVRLFFSSSNQFVCRWKMGHKVKALRERLDEIADEKNKFHLEECSYVERRLVSNGRDQTHSFPPQVVIGREHDKEEIVRLLLSPHSDENVSVVSIVGIGGLGKTTLAQMVYNDDQVKGHFELRMWVCVSDDFDLKFLVKKVLESISRKAPKANEMDPLKDLLHQKISGRRYLLVLDDVWNEDLKKWYSFKDLLGCGARGSRIVITTRLRKVAKISRPICIHELRGLLDDEAWSLFEHMAFKQQHPPNPSLDEALKKEILAKCCGVPLAIKTIGGILYFKDPESNWLLFKDKELPMIDVYKNGILPILKLSYDHLPSHYKQCFSYCSLYPKGFRIHVDTMIQLWKAQGYIKSKVSNECLHDVGLEYFMDLFQLSFFQDIEMDAFGNIERCKMHDLIHDLAISVAGENFYASHFGTVLQYKTKHISCEINESSLLQQNPSLMKAKKIRTVVGIKDPLGVTKEEVDGLFNNLRCLRVLALSGPQIDKLPNSIYKLKHLRFLVLSGNESIRELPDSISSLYFLQVLDLGWCKNLVQLPSSITTLVNLLDLDNSQCLKMCYIPRGIGNLTKLENLSEFVIAKDKSMFKNSGGLDELHSLNNLRGNLAIKNLRYVKNVAPEACLSLKQKLQTLTLDWGRYEDENDDHCTSNEVANEEMGMEALRPHQNLKALKVWFYRGMKPPSWLPSLTNLVSVSCESCSRLQRLPPLDHLPYLKELTVAGLTKLEIIEVENRGGDFLFFPSLTDLKLKHCPDLKGFERQSSSSTEELPCFPCLSRFEMRGCPNLSQLPLFPELKTMSLDRDGMELLMNVLSSASKAAPSYFSTFSRLTDLEILDMENFVENKLLHHLPSLQHLMFRNCSFRNVCSVEEDEKLWQSLKLLRVVAFRDMVNLEALPQWLQHVTTLPRLWISNCPRLECLPNWMPKLIALQVLVLIHCPRVEERCKNNTAEDWPYICHIPNTFIGGEQIQRNSCYLL